MFEQHPVPQQISSYQFRLVGDMTLKQFFQLAAGAVIGLIVYSLPLPGFFKWPLIALAVIAGAAFAFLPIQDRPLEQWLVAFFRSIYAPTIFVWQKPSNLQYFATEAQAVQPSISDQQIPEAVPLDVATHALEQNEKNYLSRLSSLFAPKGSGVAQALKAPTAPAEQVIPPGATAPAQRPPEPPKPVAAPPQGYTPPAPAPTVTIQTAPLGQVFSASGPGASSTIAQFSPEAAPPAPPTSPNIIVGQVMDAGGKIVEGAILEISDSEGRPVRALKTNKAGHFMIVTPLPDGDYQITTEGNELKFEPITVKLAGTLVSPIAIRSSTSLAEPPRTDQRAAWSPAAPSETGSGQVSVK